MANISERLNLYSKIDSLKNEAELDAFRDSMIDRFGPLPDSVKDLLETVRLRWMAEKLGFEKLTLKGEKMKGYFVSGDNEAYYKSDVFGNILATVQQFPKRFKLKEYKSKLILSVSEVLTVEEAKGVLTTLLPDQRVQV